MRQLCRFAVKAAVSIILAAVVQAASPPGGVEPRCVALGYYDRKDKLVSTPLLTAPLVDGTRISEEWGWRLHHPILKRRAFHSGVDIAAPLGTPVHAVSDGVIVAVGRYGPSGLYVRIRHNAIYETGFAHLSAFGDGIRPGVRVRKGQVVAFVGSTGLSTGPHLHFEIFVRRSRVRPACHCGAISVTAKATRARVALLPSDEPLSETFTETSTLERRD